MENESEIPTPKKEDVLFAGAKSIWNMDASYPRIRWAAAFAAFGASACQKSQPSWIAVVPHHWFSPDVIGARR